MKNIKLFGACAAVALFSACSNEEELVPSEGQVPEGMYEVTLTVDKGLSTDQSGKKRVHLDMEEGGITWNYTDDIAVLYANQDRSKTEILRFWMNTDYHYGGTPDKEVFKGLVPYDIYKNMVPIEVYSTYIWGGDDPFNPVTVENYKKVPLEQMNVEEAKGKQTKAVNISDDYKLHLHGYTDVYVNIVGFNDKFINNFTAELYLDNAALVHIDAASLPKAQQDEYPNYHYTVKVGEDTYKVNCINENMLNTKPEEGLSFFVSVPEGGIENPQFVVEGANGFSKTFTTTNDTQTGSPKKIEAANRYKLVVDPNASTSANTAKASIDGEEVDVPWVQLWAGGPKFAAFDFGTNEEYPCGRAVDYWDAQSDYAATTWGENWRTPTESDFSEFLLQNSDKVSVEFIQDSEGTITEMRFTGKQPGYTDKSLSFLYQSVEYGYYGTGYLIKSTDENEVKYALFDYRKDFGWSNREFQTTTNTSVMLNVRLVLKEPQQ